MGCPVGTFRSRVAWARVALVAAMAVPEDEAAAD
jgi:hypothetical protein